MRKLARRRRQSAPGWLVKQGVHLCGYDDSLALQDDCLVAQHRELDAGLERIHLPHRPRRILRQCGVLELPHQLHDLAVDLLVAYHPVVLVEARSNLPQKVEFRSLEVQPCRARVDPSHLAPQAPLAEQRETLRHRDPVAGIDGVAREAPRRHRHVEHRILERTRLLRACLCFPPRRPHGREPRVAFDHCPFEPTKVEDAVTWRIDRRSPNAVGGGSFHWCHDGEREQTGALVLIRPCHTLD